VSHDLVRMIVCANLLRRLMNEPRAFVVGIGWVVECVEQRIKVDEAKFQVDLEGTNVAGTNKVCALCSYCEEALIQTLYHFQRRRSMLPKHLAHTFDDIEPSTPSPLSDDADDGTFLTY
jgi:hypothetical protein